MSEDVSALKEMFPSWDEEAILDVLEIVHGDLDAATSMVIEWSLGDARDSSAQNTPPAEVQEPKIVSRAAYDEVMAKRMVRHLTPRAIKGTMSMSSKLVMRARKIKAAAVAHQRQEPPTSSSSSSSSSSSAAGNSGAAGAGAAALEAYLADRGLSHFLDALKAHGVENVRDLLNPELVPPEDLAGFEIGMNPDDVAALYTAGDGDGSGGGGAGVDASATLGPSALGRLEAAEQGSASREECIVAGKALLSERLQFMGLSTMQSGDDGNCQFRSLSSELYGSEEHHRFVRRLACEHMRSHRGDYAAFIGGGLEESGSGGGDHAAFEAYVQGMGADREWGDELTLRAVSDALGVKIHIVTTLKENWLLHYEPDELKVHEDGSASRQLFLSYVSPIHYNTVAPVR